MFLSYCVLISITLLLCVNSLCTGLCPQMQMLLIIVGNMPNHMQSKVHGIALDKAIKIKRQGIVAASLLWQQICLHSNNCVCGKQPCSGRNRAAVHTVRTISANLIDRYAFVTESKPVCWCLRTLARNVGDAGICMWQD